MADNFNILDREYDCYKTLISIGAGNFEVRAFPGEVVVIDYMRLAYTADAVVGNRVILLSLRNLAGTDVFYSLSSGFSQTANQVINYTFMPNVPREQANFNGSSVVVMPSHFVVSPGNNIFIGDGAGVSIGDSYILTIGYRVLGVRNL